MGHHGSTGSHGAGYGGQMQTYGGHGSGHQSGVQHMGTY